MIFPDDFKKSKHPFIDRAYQWSNKNSLVFISIIGGNMTYGDGINTFEMMIEGNDDVEGYLTISEINERIKYLPTINEISQSIIDNLKK